MSSNVGIIVAGVIGVISISALIIYATNKSLKNDTIVDNKEDTNRYSLSSLDDEKNDSWFGPVNLSSTDPNEANFDFNSESDNDSDDGQKGGNNKSKKNKSKKNKSKKNKSKKTK